MKAFIYLSILILLKSVHSFAQTPITLKNKWAFQFGQHTPIVGLSYHRTLWQHKTKPWLVDLGGGVGVVPGWYRPSTLVYSHNIAAIIGRKSVKFTFGYAGIIPEKRSILGNLNRYHANPHAGIIIYNKGIFAGFESNAYFYRKQFQQIINDNTLVNVIQSKVLILPSFYFGTRF